MDGTSRDYSTSLGDKILIGAPCVLIGVGATILIFLNMPNPFESMESAGKFLIVSMWDVVATLFILVGLKKLFGDRPFFARIIGQSLRRFFLIAVATTVLTVALFAMTNLIG